MILTRLVAMRLVLTFATQKFHAKQAPSARRGDAIGCLRPWEIHAARRPTVKVDRVHRQDTVSRTAGPRANVALAGVSRKPIHAMETRVNRKAQVATPRMTASAAIALLIARRSLSVLGLADQ